MHNFHSLIMTTRDAALVWYPDRPHVDVHRVQDGVIEPTSVWSSQEAVSTMEAALAWMQDHIHSLTLLAAVNHQIRQEHADERASIRSGT